MRIPLSSLFSLYILTPGRRIYALRQVRDLIQPYNLPDIVTAIDEAIAHDRGALDLDAQWRGGRTSPLLRRLDGRVDRTLTMVERLMSHFAESDDAAIASKANELLDDMFPVNVGHHTHLPYVDQSAANDRVLSILESSDHQTWLDAQGMRKLILDLRGAHDAFNAALSERDAGPTLDWSEVKKAHAEGQIRYLEVVAMIAGHFARDHETRGKLLAPVWTQNLAIQAYRRRRRVVIQDIDPDTGELLPVDATDGDNAADPGVNAAADSDD